MIYFPGSGTNVNVIVAFQKQSSSTWPTTVRLTASLLQVCKKRVSKLPQNSSSRRQRETHDAWQQQSHSFWGVVNHLPVGNHYNVVGEQQKKILSATGNSSFFFPMDSTHETLFYEELTRVAIELLNLSNQNVIYWKILRNCYFSKGFQS